jgi:hypothetical protein
LPRDLPALTPRWSTSLRDILTVALQELIEAELTATIGAGPGERSPERIAQRNVTARSCCPHRPATSKSASRSCARVRSSRSCWSRVAGWIGRCGR